MDAKSPFATMTQSVEAIIGYHFNDNTILWEALQAPGCIAPRHGRNLMDGNKRLALLGDGILKVVLMIDWYSTGTPRGAGNQIVNTVGANAHLASIGRQNSISDFINLNPGHSGAASNGTVADTVEAIIGAVWLDSQDMNVVKQMMTTIGLVAP